ncbi:hypothetical protein MYX07_06815 [Patescibacteria group bacterium AH-259-L07]|nr:hypothetical protein [Patescibacteria group bacterium AH-259-L07]
MWLLLLTGFLGGVIRGLVGFIKHQFSFKDVSFNVYYFFAMMILSGIVGMVIALVINKDPLFSFVIGYAGGDFIENVYKTVFKKPSLYPIK